MGKAGPALAISLDAPQNSFVPGDTIIGFVSRQVPTVATFARVTIALYGRAKSKKTERRSNGNGSSNHHYRGRFDLVSERSNTTKIFEGPLHIPAGEAQTWPFAIMLPTHVESGAGGAYQEESYLPLGAGLAHELPATFAGYDTGGMWSNTKLEAFVEYCLVARLVSKSKGVADRHDSILPLFVRSVAPHPPIIDFNQGVISTTGSVSSQRLIPGMEDAKLSFSQKTKKLFNASSVPTFNFRLEVQVPRVLQLDNLSKIPFLLRVVPNWELTSDIIRDVPQKVKLTTLLIEIKAVTEIVCEGTFSPHYGSYKNALCITSSQVKNCIVPSTNDAPAADVGRPFEGRIRTGIPDGLHPDFTTFNIRHDHYMAWEIGLEIAGEKYEASSRTGVVILPPSDTRAGSYLAPPVEGSAPDAWIQPPTEQEPPPSFADVKREDLAQMESRVDGNGSNGDASGVRV